MKTKKKIIEGVIKEISENKAKILDDFAKAYLASRWDYFSKQKKIDFRRLELVEQRDSNCINGKITTTYFFRLRKGKLKQKLTK